MNCRLTAKGKPMSEQKLLRETDLPEEKKKNATEEELEELEETEKEAKKKQVLTE